MKDVRLVLVEEVSRANVAVSVLGCSNVQTFASLSCVSRVLTRYSIQPRYRPPLTFATYHTHIP